MNNVPETLARSGTKVAPKIMVMIFCDFLMFDQIFLLPQVKRSVIISNKHGIYELPHKLPNELRLTNLGN